MDNMQQQDDFLFDEINGGKGKKPVLSLLNKSRLSKFEMDEIFCDD